MSDFYRYYESGKEDERERIIKLLEELEEHDWLEIQFHYLIALIKGEQK